MLGRYFVCTRYCGTVHSWLVFKRVPHLSSGRKSSLWVPPLCEIVLGSGAGLARNSRRDLGSEDKEERLAGHVTWEKDEGKT